jgi:hypothetical protein
MTKDPITVPLDCTVEGFEATGEFPFLEVLRASRRGRGLWAPRSRDNGSQIYS